MADIIFNQALGKAAEWAARVNANDPTNAVLEVSLLAASGIETDAVLRDKDDYAALVSGATNEATNTGYTGDRRVLDQTGGITVIVDDTGDKTDIDFPDVTWTAVANDGTGAIGDLVVSYDSDSTGGTDANIIPMTLHDFVITPDGSDITAQLPTQGFFSASE